jgi:plastocyanin
MRVCPLFVLLSLAVTGCNSDATGNNNPHPPTHDVAIQKNAMGLGANAFSPATITISLASQTTVKWYNADFAGSSYGGVNGTAHKVFSDDATTFASGNIPPQGTFIATLTTPGTYTYHCAIHPSMTGTVIVNP